MRSNGSEWSGGSACLTLVYLARWHRLRPGNVFLKIASRDYSKLPRRSVHDSKSETSLQSYEQRLRFFSETRVGVSDCVSDRCWLACALRAMLSATTVVVGLLRVAHIIDIRAA